MRQTEKLGAIVSKKIDAVMVGTALAVVVFMTWQFFAAIGSIVAAIIN